MSVWIKDKRGGGGAPEELTNRVTQLENNTLNKTSNNQTAASLQVTKTPTTNTDVLRRQDNLYRIVVNHSSNLTANTTVQWSLTGVNAYANSGGKYEHLVTFTVGNNRFNFSWKVETQQNINSFSPVHSFSTDENSLDETVKIMCRVQNSVFKVRCNQTMSSIRVYRRDFSNM